MLAKPPQTATAVAESGPSSSLLLQSSQDKALQFAPSDDLAALTLVATFAAIHNHRRQRFADSEFLPLLDGVWPVGGESAALWRNCDRGFATVVIVNDR